MNWQISSRSSQGPNQSEVIRIDPLSSKPGGSTDQQHYAYLSLINYRTYIFSKTDHALLSMNPKMLSLLFIPWVIGKRTSSFSKSISGLIRTSHARAEVAVRRGLSGRAWSGSDPRSDSVASLVKLGLKLEFMGLRYESDSFIFKLPLSTSVPQTGRSVSWRLRPLDFPPPPHPVIVFIKCLNCGFQSMPLFYRAKDKRRMNIRELPNFTE